MTRKPSFGDAVHRPLHPRTGVMDVCVCATRLAGPAFTWPRSQVWGRMGTGGMMDDVSWVLRSRRAEREGRGCGSSHPPPFVPSPSTGA